jgi:hypothetical protein
MQPYAINVSFVLTGKALERFKGQTVNLPGPPPGVNTGFYPNVGDVISAPGFDAFTLIVAVREILFSAGGLQVNCYLDTTEHDRPPADLKVVK